VGSKITLARTGNDAGYSFRRFELDISNGTIFVSEVTGTAMLLLLGCGVVATAILKGSKGEGGGWLLINFGWGLAVFCGVYVAFRSGAHLNPAVTLALNITGNITFAQSLVYYAAELVGAFIGAIIAWLAFKEHFDTEEDAGKKLAVFSTGPAIRNYAWNTLTEIIGTFVLIFVILISGGTAGGGATDFMRPLFVALIVVSIGASLGGPTGYAINPARDLGPRIAHAILPIRGKGGSDWAYSWVPVVGPMIGGALGALAFLALGGTGIFPGVV
jgi:glycerol uptake facilitator protein